MITITFQLERWVKKVPKYTLKITGHAKTGKAKTAEDDLICAAVSALHYGLEAALCSTEGLLKDEKHEFRDESGKGIVSASPVDGAHEPNLRMIFWSYLCGLDLIAQKYPDKVKMVVKPEYLH